jgi:plastocyanin
MSMTATPATWKMHVKTGDVLSLQAIYDTSSRSWYESMGIMIAWYAPGAGGNSSFSAAVSGVPGVVTHGHLSPENDNHGGGVDAGLPDSTGLPNGAPTTAIDISNFEYGPADLDMLGQVPTVHQGGHITFTNLDAPTSGFGTFHTITACKLPCNKATGLSFPLPDNPVVFDSGQLGNYGPPTKGTRTWSTPANLPPGDYTFYCRVHPLMRGVFRVIP